MIPLDAEKQTETPLMEGIDPACVFLGNPRGVLEHSLHRGCVCVYVGDKLAAGTTHPRGVLEHSLHRGCVCVCVGDKLAAGTTHPRGRLSVN